MHMFHLQDHFAESIATYHGMPWYAMADCAELRYQLCWIGVGSITSWPIRSVPWPPWPRPWKKLSELPGGILLFSHGHSVSLVRNLECQVACATFGMFKMKRPLVHGCLLFTVSQKGLKNGTCRLCSQQQWVLVCGSGSVVPSPFCTVEAWNSGLKNDQIGWTRITQIQEGFDASISTMSQFMTNLLGGLHSLTLYRC